MANVAVLVNKGTVLMNRYPLSPCPSLCRYFKFLKLSPLSSTPAIKLNIFKFSFGLWFSLWRQKNLWHCPFTMGRIMILRWIYYLHEIFYTWSIPEVLWILWSGPASGSGTQPETTHPPPKVHTQLNQSYGQQHRQYSYCILYHCIMFYIINIQLTVICSLIKKKIKFSSYSIHV